MKKILLSYGRYVLAISLLGFVFSRIDFRDALECDKDTRLMGTIILRGETRLFRADKASIPASLLADLAARGETVVVEGSDRVEIRMTGRLKDSYGMFHYFRRVDPGMLWLALCLYAATFLLASYRWLLLLHSHGLRLGYLETIKINLIGQFCNNFLPGTTGGDVVKAVLVARKSRQKAKSFIAVFTDRAIGLGSLFFFCGVVMLGTINEPRFRKVAYITYGGIALLLLGGACYFSRRVRRWFGLDRLIAKLPFPQAVQSVDQALFHYRSDKPVVLKAILLTVMLQGLVIVFHLLLGRGMGMEAEPRHYFMLMPVIFIAMAVPISLAGIGWGEGLYAYFWGIVGVPAEQAVALSLLYRFFCILASLPGGFFFWFSDQATRDTIAHADQEKMADALPEKGA